MRRPRSGQYLDVSLVVIAALAASTSGPLAKAASGLSAIGVGAGRCGVAALVLFALAPRETFATLAALDRRTRLAVAGAGLLLAAHFALFLGGLANTSLPAAVALVSLEPLMVVLAGWMTFGLRPNAFELGGVVVAMLGAAVVTHGAGEGEHRWLGDVMVVAAAAVYGAYVMAARGLRERLPMVAYASAVFGAAFLFLTPFALWLAASAPPPPATTWWIVLAMGLLPTVVGHTLIQRLSRRVAPSVVALVSPGETVGSIAIGLLMLSAWPTMHEWIGAGLVVSGAALAVVGAGRGAGRGVTIP